MIKKLCIYAGTFFASVIVLWTALVLTTLIPNEKLYENMLTSAMQLNGADPFPQNGGRNTITDNYADVILLNVIRYMDSSSPFVSSLDTKYFDGCEDDIDYGENYGLYAALNGAAPNTDYSRYWHGSAVFVRPLMTVTDLDGVRIIGLITALVLLAVCCALLAKRRLYLEAAALAVSFFCVQLWNIRLAIEYHPAVLTALALLPFFILLEKKGDTALIVLSVISGTMIAFFDFLTAETLTILIPLILVMSARFSEGRFEGAKKEGITSIKCLGAWGISYMGMFLVKWTAASAVTGENKFIAALSSAEERIGGSVKTISPIAQIFAAPFTNISTMLGGTNRADILPGIIGIALIAAAVIAAIRLSRYKADAKGFLLVMLLLGAVPYVRYLVLSNHSYLHDFFTYRAQAAVILALITSIGAAAKQPSAVKRKKN